MTFMLVLAVFNGVFTLVNLSLGEWKLALGSAAVGGFCLLAAGSM